MSQLMVSVAGIRGIIGDSLTPEVIVKYVKAFSKYCGSGTIVVGRDSRPSGKQISDLVCAVLNFCGHDVINLGISTTPTIEMGVQLYNGAGGIAITASHNPLEWNALKFFGADTLFLNEEQGAKLQGFIDNPDEYLPFDQVGTTIIKDQEVNRYHIKKVLDLPYLNKSAIRKRNFKVLLDCVNGAGGVILPDLLTDLGCSVTKINCEPTGLFAHGAEPLPENLVDTCEIIKNGKFDLGMVVDPDSDRLALISEEGKPLGEEYTLAMVIDLILSKEKSDVAVNVSTTKAIEDIAARYGAKVYRTKVGEINVSQKMLSTGCIIGGEGNGGVILPSIHPGRDAVIGAALILQYLLEKEKSISSIQADLPQYTIIKDKMSVAGINYEASLANILKDVDPASVDQTDGLKINFSNSWIQLRKSNTEPIVRLFAEAATADEAMAIIANYKKKLQ